MQQSRWERILSPHAIQRSNLTKVRRLPVETSICRVEWRVTIGWCGGEYVAMNYMHANIETMRTFILPTNIQCHNASPDQTLEITVPSYGSINEINLKIKLDGGVGEASFQPNSYCKGNQFTPPRNTQRSLEYIDHKKHYEKKEQWEVETIRRAVVTYEFSARVTKQTAYITDNDKKVVIPNLVAFNRTNDKTAEELLETSSAKDMGFNILEFELEGYKDSSIGTIVFNNTNLPQNRCQHFRSVAKISDGLLFRSKSNSFFIYKYARNEESIAVTLHKNMKSCGKKFYHTGIPGVYVVLLEDNEGFLENKGLSLVEMEDDTIVEAEIHGAMNSVELSNDKLYMDINFRACELARQNIITAQALLKEDLEIVRDRKGRPLSTHVNGEAVTLYKCHPTMVRIQHDELRCCQEMPIWHDENYSNSAFLQPVSKRVTEVCTPRICNKFDIPLFNIGSEIIPNWVKIED